MNHKTKILIITTLFGAVFLFLIFLIFRNSQLRTDIVDQNQVLDPRSSLSPATYFGISDRKQMSFAGKKITLENDFEFNNFFKNGDDSNVRCKLTDDCLVLVASDQKDKYYFSVAGYVSEGIPDNPSFELITKRLNIASSDVDVNLLRVKLFSEGVDSDFVLETGDKNLFYESYVCIREICISSGTFNFSSFEINETEVENFFNFLRSLKIE